jgi:hypothetical protein
MSAWGMRSSHSVRGNLGLHVARPEQKWYIQVWMARSAALWRWLCGYVAGFVGKRRCAF